MADKIIPNQLSDASAIYASIGLIESSRVELSQSNNITVQSSGGSDNLNALLTEAAQNRVVAAIDRELRALALSKKDSLTAMGVNTAGINIAPELSAS